MFSLRYSSSTRFVLPAIGFAGFLALSGSATASQLIAKSSCSVVVDVPGIIGTGHLKYNIARGLLFNHNKEGKYCGTTTMDTPFGPSPDDQCFVVADGQLVSGIHGGKVSSSDCVLEEATAMSASFDAKLAATYVGTGPASLHGQAFLKTVVGDVKTCAGEFVYILPGMPYVEEVIKRLHDGVDVQMDERAKSLSRQTVCDAQGNFTFTGLPAHRWVIATQVKWGVPHIEQPGENPGPIGLLFGMHGPPAVDEQGGELMQAIDLQPGDNQAFLTSRDQQ